MPAAPDKHDRSGASDSRTVLIFMATAGGGHLASARALRDALAERGHRAIVLDGLAVMSPRLRWFQVDFYAWQLKHSPWSYGTGFWMLGFRPVAGTVRRLIGLFWGDKLLATIDEIGPDVVVSTYPVVTAGLGRLVAAGRLRQPVVAIVTDYGAHPLWVAPEIDLHLVPCRRTLELVEGAGGRGRVMTYPVSDRFANLPSRDVARAAFGLPADALVPLIVGGTWGVGDIEGATAAAVASGAHPVVVTAGNAELRTALEQRYAGNERVHILGWTDRLPELMAAADCLIQSAGGVTCLEAIAIGLPIVFVNPIHGHGRFNAQIMADSGAVAAVVDNGGLERLLRSLLADSASLRAPARDAGCSLVPTVLAPPPRPPRVVAVPARRRAAARPLIAAMLLVLIGWFVFSPSAMGLAAAHTPLPVVDAGPPSSVSIVVLTDDPAIATALESAIARDRLPVALFVEPSAIGGLSPDSAVTFGLAEDRSSARLSNPYARRRRLLSAATALDAQVGAMPRYVLPRANRCGLYEVALLPRHTQVLDDVRADEGTARSGLNLVDARGMAGDAAVAAVRDEVTEATAAGLQIVPLTEMS